MAAPTAAWISRRSHCGRRLLDLTCVARLCIGSIFSSICLPPCLPPLYRPPGSIVVFLRAVPRALRCLLPILNLVQPDSQIPKLENLGDFTSRLHKVRRRC